MILDSNVSKYYFIICCSFLPCFSYPRHRPAIFPAGLTLRGATRFGRLGVDLVALWHWSQRGKGSAEGTWMAMVGGFFSLGKFRGFPDKTL